MLKAMDGHMKDAGQVISIEDWVKIQQYYLNNAPNAFYSSAVKDMPLKQDLFELDTTHAYHEYLNDYSTLVKVTESNDIIVGQSDGQLIKIKDQQVEEINIDGIPTDYVTTPRQDFILNMGTLGPSDNQNGSILKLDNGQLSTIVDSLIRPISFKRYHNGRDNNNWLVSQFGSTREPIPTGGLSLHNQKDRTYVDPTTGATMAKLIDIDHDGSEEIIALYGQANESIKSYSLPFNDTQGWSPKTLLTFPPLYGTNSFDVVDIDGDGDLDIVTTHGDNDDYSKVFKPYHGLRVHINNGANEYEESYFYHINGASKVIARDYDIDGDQDLMTVAMYADYFSRTHEVLLLFKNDGTGTFEPHYFEIEPKDNYVLMDAGDIDRDGDIDIVLATNRGLHMQQPQELTSKWKTRRAPIAIYYNQSAGSK